MSKDEQKSCDDHGAPERVTTPKRLEPRLGRPRAAQGAGQRVHSFTVTLDGSKLSDAFSLYWRVVSKNQPPPDPRPGRTRRLTSRLRTCTKCDCRVEDRHAETEPVVRGPPGEYDVYVVVKEPDPEEEGRTAKVGFLKQSVSVTDLWNNEFSTGSVIVAEQVDPLPAPLTAAPD